MKNNREARNSLLNLMKNVKTKLRLCARFEAELGKLAGIEDDVNVSDEDSSYTQPDEVEEFVTKLTWSDTYGLHTFWLLRTPAG